MTTRPRTQASVARAVGVVGVDAVFEKDGEGARIREAPPPAKTDVADVAQRVHERALVWLRRHRYLDERPAEDRGNE